MKISIDKCHNPMRGHVACTHCGTPIQHLGDDMHEYLAKKAAVVCGMEWDPKYVHSTPGELYGYMIEMAAKHLAARVDHNVFCQYCGKAIQQPRMIGDKHVLPRFAMNNWKSVGNWCAELGLEGLPVDDYHTWSNMAYAQSEASEFKYT